MGMGSGRLGEPVGREGRFGAHTAVQQPQLLGPGAQGDTPHDVPTVHHTLHAPLHGSMPDAQSAADGRVPQPLVQQTDDQCVRTVEFELGLIEICTVQ